MTQHKNGTMIDEGERGVLVGTHQLDTSLGSMQIGLLGHYVLKPKEREDFCIACLPL
jgi:hypothetical protein